MRHMNRTHGVSIASLHELHEGGHFVLEYVPSALQCADIFTKPFTVPLQWEAVCRLVNVCSPENVESMIQNKGIPYGVAPSPESKHGVWFCRPDGSGAWVRRDRRAKQHQQLRGAGPARHEVVARHTVCSVSRAPLVPVMGDFATSSSVTEPLPGDVPRDVLTIFEFRRSTQRKTESYVSLAQHAPLLPAIIAEVFQ